MLKDHKNMKMEVWNIMITLKALTTAANFRSYTSLKTFLTNLTSSIFACNILKQYIARQRFQLYLSISDTVNTLLNSKQHMLQRDWLTINAAKQCLIL